MDIQNIIRQHGKSVAVVFKKNGINKPATADNLILHTILKGPDFIEQIADQVGQDSLYTGLEGDPLFNIDINKTVADAKARIGGNQFNATQTLPAAVVQKKKTILDALHGVLSAVAEPLGQWAGAKKAAQAGPLVYNTATGSYAALPGGYSPLAPVVPPVDPKKKDTTIILIIAAVVVLGLIAAIAANKK